MRSVRKSGRACVRSSVHPCVLPVSLPLPLSLSLPPSPSLSLPPSLSLSLRFRPPQDTGGQVRLLIAGPPALREATAILVNMILNATCF